MEPACLSPPTNINPLDDADIWGENDEVTNQEWSKMDEDFTNAGYREGITAGKESALQEGFDDGFATVGAPLGRDIGVLRGTANAVMSLLSSSRSRTAVQPDGVILERCKEEVRTIIGGLGRIHLVDLAPRDLQAEEHAREHLENQTSGEVHITVGSVANGASPSQAVEYQLSALNGEPSAVKPAVEELRQLRMRLSAVLDEVGLDILLA